LSPSIAVSSQVVQDVVLRVARAFPAFFRRLKAGAAAGYPRCQGRNRYHGFRYPQVGEHGGARLDNGFLVRATIGRLAVRWSRPLEGTPKTATVSREADGWYVSISGADVPIHPLPETGQETGIDLGVEAFATLADGMPIANPRSVRLAEMQLKRAQRRVARRVKWSNRRRKAVTLLAKAHAQAHAKVRRARRDFHHKAALALVRQYGTISHEDLPAANMVPNDALAKRISDAGWGQFLSILSFTAA
ncbi:MAG TPA: transposase, partial [Ktedonobacterales bacterium]|nr:transposase [Ktedonobacterales bacterium]